MLLYISVCLRARQDTISYSFDIYVEFEEQTPTVSSTWIAADRRAVLSSRLSPVLASIVPEQQQVQHADVYYLAQYRGAVSALQLVV